MNSFINWVVKLHLETKLEVWHLVLLLKNDKYKEEHIMNIDKIAPMAAVAISLIAVFVPFEYWGLLFFCCLVSHMA